MNLKPSQPCPHPAGSPGKIAALRERLTQRQPLFHPDDNRTIVEPVRCSRHDDALLEAMRLYAPIETNALATPNAERGTRKASS